MCAGGVTEGSRARPLIQTDSLDSVFSAKHKRVKFILQQCQLPSAVLSLTAHGSESAEGERQDISCIISSSAKRCLSDLVHDMPPCFSVSSPWRFYTQLCLYLTDAVFFFFFLNLSASLYLSPSIFISLFSSHTSMAALQLAAGMGARCGLSWVSLLLPLLRSRRLARGCLSLYIHFWPHGQEGVFSVALGPHFQKAFSRSVSVCAARQTKTRTPFFQPEVLVLASWTAFCTLPPSTHTHHSPVPSLKHQIFHFWKQGRGGDTVHLWKQTGRLLWRVQCRLERWEAGKCKRSLHYHRLPGLWCMLPGFLKALLWPKSSFF